MNVIKAITNLRGRDANWLRLDHAYTRVLYHFADLVHVWTELVAELTKQRTVDVDAIDPLAFADGRYLLEEWHVVARWMGPRLRNLIYINHGSRARGKKVGAVRAVRTVRFT